MKAKLETKALKAKRPGFTDERYNETSYYHEPENSKYRHTDINNKRVNNNLSKNHNARISKRFDINLFIDLRKVYPYYFTFTTFTKGRWVGERILDVFAREFRAHPATEYVRIDFSITIFFLIILIIIKE